MMDRDKQEKLGHKFGVALQSAGIVVSRAVAHGGNIQRWEEVDGASILGRLQAMTGWRVDEVRGTVPDPRQLEILP